MFPSCEGPDQLSTVEVNNKTMSYKKLQDNMLIVINFPIQSNDVYNCSKANLPSISIRNASTPHPHAKFEFGLVENVCQVKTPI